MAENQLVKVGDEAPDFTTKDQHNREVKLSDLRGKIVLLSFHPLAFTPVCTLQMQSLEEHKKDFDELNVVALGFSVDTVPAKHAWAKDIGVRQTQLPSDFYPLGGVSRKYGLFMDEAGHSKRANIVVDENGKVAFVKVYEISELPDIDEVINFIRDMKKKEEK